jgi:hypothetical protein
MYLTGLTFRGVHLDGPLIALAVLLALILAFILQRRANRDAILESYKAEVRKRQVLAGRVMPFSRYTFDRYNPGGGTHAVNPPSAAPGRVNG